MTPYASSNNPLSTLMASDELDLEALEQVGGGAAAKSPMSTAPTSNIIAVLISL